MLRCFHSHLLVGGGEAVSRLRRLCLTLSSGEPLLTCGIRVRKEALQMPWTQCFEKHGFIFYSSIASLSSEPTKRNGTQK